MKKPTDTAPRLPRRPAAEPIAPPEPAPPDGLESYTLGDGVALLVFPLPRAALSPSERDIVEQIALGRSNAQIAASRQRSVRTVANQVASVFRKLGVASRSELVSHAALLGGRTK